jgi:AbiTii
MLLRMKALAGAIIRLMLLDKIIELATDNRQPLTVLLRQCIVLAYDLKNEGLKEWANHELNGYPDSENMPEYRILPAGATGLFIAPGWTRFLQRIPSVALEKKHRKLAEIVEMTESVGALEHMLTSGSENSQIQFGWNANLVLFYREKLQKGWQLFSAHQDVPKSAIAGMLDTIRTRVLNLALELKNEIGESDADLKRVKEDSAEAEKVNSIVLTQIFGGTVYMAGGQQNINVQNIAVGNWEDLKKVLSESGIDEKDVAELSHALQQDNKTMGATVKGWISKNAGKVFNSGLQVGVSVGTTILTQYIKRHLGLPP